MRCESVAVRDFGGAAKAGIAAARAGVDLLLYADPEAARSATRALPRGLISHELGRERAFVESAGRVLRLRHSFGTAASDSQR